MIPGVAGMVAVCNLCLPVVTLQNEKEHAAAAREGLALREGFQGHSCGS